MLLNNLEYTVTGRFDKNLVSTNEIECYTFKDNFENEYILRTLDSVYLVKKACKKCYP